MGDSGRNEATGAARPAAAPQASNYPFSGIRGYNGKEEEAATAAAAAAATTMRGMATRPATWHALMQ